MISRELEVSSKKQQGNPSVHVHGKTSTPNEASSTSLTSWGRLKDPRIVRSQALGGKDRHSKVCTMRGLRDRRVRLSVPTAILVYDLQHKLGLNQPSKVVDWLLNEAKTEIDELPPLLMPIRNNLSPNDLGSCSTNKEALNLSSFNYWHDHSLMEPSISNVSITDDNLRFEFKEAVTETTDDDHSQQQQFSFNPKFVGVGYKDQNNWIRSGEEYCILENHGPHHQNNFFSRSPNNSSLPAHSGSHHNDGLPIQQPEDIQNINVLAFPSTMSMPLGSQVLMYPPGLSRSFNIASTSEFDRHKEISFHQMLSSCSDNNPSLSSTSLIRSTFNESTSQYVTPLYFLPSQNNEGK